MSRKRILVVCPGGLFPAVMGSQVRTRLLVESLSKVHSVDLVTLENEVIDEAQKRRYEGLCRRHFPLLVPNHKQSLFGRAYHRLGSRLASLLLARPVHFYYATLRANQRRILRQAEESKYDIIQVEYYFGGRFLDWLATRPRIALDAQNILHQKAEMELSCSCPSYVTGWSLRRQVAKEKKLEMHVLSQCDLIISITPVDKAFLEVQYPGKKHIMIPTGVDLSPFLCAHFLKAVKPTLLFYGALRSAQNVSAFEVLWEEIVPKIRREIPDVQLQVVGSNPPERIRSLAKEKNIAVTGFVDDVAPVLGACHVMVLPMKCGTGFRTRLVEVMAAGVPVVGTHIAVDSLGFEDGIHGYANDDHAVLAKRTIELLRDAQKREQLGRAAQHYVAGKYSIGNTYGRLAKYYEELD